MQWKIKLTRWFVYKWEKRPRQKSHRVILRSPLPRNPLLSQQPVTSKGIPVPYINLHLNPYPNTQLDLFCSDNLSFLMHNSKYVTNQLMHGSKYVTNHKLEKNVDCKVLQFINTMKVTKLLGYKILQRINVAASSRERWIRAYVSSHNMPLKNIWIKLYQL